MTLSTLSTEIGQATFVEAIKVTAYNTPTCVPNVVLGRSKWQNPRNRFAVLGRDTIDIDDYRAVESYLRAYGAGDLPGAKPDNQHYVDVDGDGKITTRDLSQLARYINDGSTVDNADEECHHVTDIRLERDLVDPSTVTTVANVAAKKNILPRSSYRVFFRDYVTNDLTETIYPAAVKTKDSLIFIHTDLFDCPACGPHVGAPGCAPEPCIFAILRQRLRCSTECLPTGISGRVLGCFRKEILPARYIPDFERDVCIPEPTTPVPDIPESVLVGTVVIAVYDEANEFYVENCSAAQLRDTAKFCYPGSPQDRYDGDKEEWDVLIDGIKNNARVNVRMGLIQPYHYRAATGGYWDVICDGCDWPKDSDRDQISHVLLPGPANPTRSNAKRSPRVTTDEFMAMFNDITSNGIYEPTFILFVLDNSGSVYVNDYQAQLEAAKAQIKMDFPDVVILDDLVTARPERWVQASTEAVRRIIGAYGAPGAWIAS